MTGFLIPPWYKDEVPGTAEMNIASIIFGFSLGSAIFTASKAATQSFAAYKRGRLFSAYIVMCWLEWIGCNCMGIVTYIWLKGIIEPRIKWGVALIASLINLSGFCIWIPARLQVSKLYDDINVVWDRTEKGVFLVVDLGLNLYFIYLVRSRLIAYGLTKYNRLFHFNVVMVFISVTLDCVLMGATFLPSHVV
ncbi:hypothetical protein AUP68_04218 [Ilyonectria robusta]